MLNRRDALFAGAVAAAIPASAFADGSVSLVTLQKARLRYVDTFEQAPFSFQEPNSSYRFPRLSFPPPIVSPDVLSHSYGQKVLSLVDADTDKIVAEANTIKLYVSAVDRAAGKKVDPRKSGANKIIALAKV